MSNTIIFPVNPIYVDETEWLLQNIGRISVALETSNQNFVDIIAYSDNRSDLPELHNIAKNKGGYLIKNNSERGVDYIDKCTY